MYKSPIDISFEQYINDVVTAEENAVMSAVLKCDINVDKDELVKALAYDRGQYEKGYADANAELMKHGKWIYGNEFHWYVASCNKCGYQRRTDIKAEGWNQWKFCPNCGARMDEE